MNTAKQWEIDLIFYHILSHPDNEDLFLWDEKLTGDERWELEWAAERDQQPSDPHQGEINKASGSARDLASDANPFADFDWGWPIKGEESQ